MSRSDRILKVIRSQPVYQTVLICEALLSHIKSLLHCHGEGHTKRKDEAEEEDDDVYEVDVVRYTSRGAYKRQVLKMSEAIVNEA